MASRCTSDSSETGEGVRDIVLLVGVGWVQVVLTQANLGSDGTDPSSVGVNDTSADCDTCREAKVRGSLLGKGTNALSSGGVFAVLVKC